MRALFRRFGPRTDVRYMTRQELFSSALDFLRFGAIALLALVLASTAFEAIASVGSGWVAMVCFAVLFGGGVAGGMGFLGALYLYLKGVLRSSSYRPAAVWMSDLKRVAVAQGDLDERQEFLSVTVERLRNLRADQLRDVPIHETSALVIAGQPCVLTIFHARHSEAGEMVVASIGPEFSPPWGGPLYDGFAAGAGVTRALAAEEILAVLKTVAWSRRAAQSDGKGRAGG